LKNKISKNSVCDENNYSSGTDALLDASLHAASSRYAFVYTAMGKI
jgi:hypothetical protein